MLKFKSKSLDLHLICIIVPVSGRLNFLCSSFFWHNYKPIPIQYPTSGKNSNWMGFWRSEEKPKIQRFQICEIV